MHGLGVEFPSASVATRQRPDAEIISPHGQRCRQHIPSDCGSTADAKPFWAVLYRSLNLMHAEDYEYRRLSIWEMSSRCYRLTMMAKYMHSIDLVAREGVEPPTPAFSELIFPVFPTTSMVAVGLLNTGKYEQHGWTVGDCRG